MIKIMTFGGMATDSTKGGSGGGGGAAGGAAGAALFPKSGRTPSLRAGPRCGPAKTSSNSAKLCPKRRATIVLLLCGQYCRGIPNCQLPSCCPTAVTNTHHRSIETWVGLLIDSEGLSNTTEQ